MEVLTESTYSAIKPHVISYVPISQVLRHTLLVNISTETMHVLASKIIKSC